MITRSSRPPPRPRATIPAMAATSTPRIVALVNPPDRPPRRRQQWREDL